MKNKSVARVEQQRRRRERRRYPFSERTKLIELVEKRHYGDVMNLVNRLRPYLQEGEGDAFTLTRLYFDLDRLVGQRQFVYSGLAEFLRKVRADDGLRCSQAVFFRYLSSAEHSNLGISEKSLKETVYQMIKQLF